MQTTPALTLAAPPVTASISNQASSVYGVLTTLIYMARFFLAAFSLSSRVARVARTPSSLSSADKTS